LTCAGGHVKFAYGLVKTHELNRVSICCGYEYGWKSS